MNLTPLLFGAGAVGPFASRVFLPAFVTALMLRFGPHVPVIEHLHLLAHVTRQPDWFTSNTCLIILGVLAAVETFGQKSADVRHVFHEIDIYLKSALALLTTLGVMSATDSSFVRHVARQAGLAEGWIPVVAALATWQVARARQPVARAVFDHLQGTHLDHLLSWAEDGWAAVGPVFLVLFPFVMLALTAAVVGGILWTRHRLVSAERAARVACPQCRGLVFPCAMACPTCRRPVDRPAAVGFLGLSKPYPATDLAAQPFRLASYRRCPACAAHLPPARPRLPCGTCGDATRATPAFAAAYAAAIGRRVPTVLAVTFALGLIPFVGLIAGSVYYRSVLVLPFDQYLPHGRAFLTRWGVRLLFLLLAVCQIIPLLGGFVVPAMAVISFGAYRRAYLAVMTDPVHDGPAVATALAV